MESALPTRLSPHPGNVRAYLAGGGTTLALIAAAVAIFIGIAAYVAFEGFPLGADDSADGTVSLAAGVPEAAAAAAAPAPGAVAATPATPSDAALGEILAALPPGATGGGPGFDGNGPNGPGNPPGSNPPGSNPPGSNPPGSNPGALGNTVGALDNTTGNLGLNLGLGGLTSNLTAPLDKAVNDTVNGVGGLLGDKQLGDKVVGGLNKTTNGLLGPGGLTDKLLKP